MFLGEEITKRLVDKLLMELRIATNPHLEQDEAKKLLQELLDRRRELYGPDEHGEELDKEALDALKQQIQNNSKLLKAK